MLILLLFYISDELENNMNGNMYVHWEEYEVTAIFKLAVEKMIHSAAFAHIKIGEQEKTEGQ